MARDDLLLGITVEQSDQSLVSWIYRDEGEGVEGHLGDGLLGISIGDDNAGACDAEDDLSSRVVHGNDTTHSIHRHLVAFRLENLRGKRGERETLSDT